MHGPGHHRCFRHAELLADALDDGLRRRRPFDEALADYERWRSATAMPMYAFTYSTSSLAPLTPRKTSYSRPSATTRPSPDASSGLRRDDARPRLLRLAVPGHLTGHRHDQQGVPAMPDLKAAKAASSATPGCPTAMHAVSSSFCKIRK